MSRHFIFLFILLAIGFLSSAQTITHGRENIKAVIDFSESAKYYETHPQTHKTHIPFDEEAEELPKRPKADPSKIFLYQPVNNAKTNQAGRMALLPVSIAPTDTFLSVTSDGSEIPPDTHGAVDSEYIVTAVNPDVKLQYRSSGIIRTTSLDTWFSPVLPHGPGTFDPRIHYDPYTKRWIMAALAYGETGNSELIVAASENSNPNGHWYCFSVLVDPTGANWLDFDNIGFNKQWIVVCGNWFSNGGGGGGGAQVYVFNKDSVLAGTGAPYTSFYESNSFSLAPAVTYDTNVNSIELVEMWDGASGELHLMKITGTPSSPTIATVGYPSTTTKWSRSDNFGETDFAPQLGTSNRIQTNDDRINNLSERNGKLWTSHNAFFPYNSTPTRCSVMWWEIDTSGTVNQNALIDDPTNNTFYAFPSIAVNQYNDAMIGFSMFSARTYPNAAYAIHMNTDPADSTRPPYIFKHGLNNYFQNFGGSQNRWGDYSSTVIDPLNNTDFWTIQESVPASPANIWDTWWAHVSLCYINDTVNFTSSSVNPNNNDTFTVSGNNSGGAVYTWNFGGGIATPGTGSGPQVVSWDSSGFKVVTLSITTNGGCTSNYSDTIFVTNLAVPNVANPGIRFNLTPNPNNGNFDIVFGEIPKKPFTVHINDIKGNTVFSHEYSAMSGTNLPITLNNIIPGNYIVNVIMEDIYYSSKLTIN